MGELKMEAFRKELKHGELRLCYILHGKERYLLEHYTKELRKAVLGQEDDPFNLRQYEGKELDVAELAEAVDAYPSFAERTLVEVRDFDLFHCDEDQTQQLTALLKDLPDHCCLVFLFDTVEYKPEKRKKLLFDAVGKFAATVEFPVQGQGELTKWVIRHFAAQKKEISSDDASYLIFLCGSLMEGLVNEIGKIAIYAKGSRITREDIDAVAVPVVEAQVFHMTNALSGKRYDEAAELMHKLFQTNTVPEIIIGAIASQLRCQYTAKLVKNSGGSLSTLIGIVGKSDFACKQYMRICDSFTSEWYCEGIRRCTEIAYRMRGADPEEMLTSLFLHLAGDRKA
jgi:DNA polymerase-3 subunit delta